MNIDKNNILKKNINYWPSFVDVIFSILIFFVFILMVQFLANPNMLVNMVLAARQNQFSKKFEQAFSEEIHNGDISISRDGNLQKLCFGEHLLFPKGSVELYETGKGLILQLSFLIQEYAAKNVFKSISIEGHTDSDKIIKTYNGIETNWELSAMRAVKVVRYLIEECNIAPGLLSATGYSYYQNITGNKNKREKARNRRIEICIIYTVKDIIK